MARHNHQDHLTILQWNSRSIVSKLSFKPSGISKPFELFELEAALSKIKNTAAGLVRIPYVWLRELPGVALEWFLAFLNYFLIRGNLNTKLKNSLLARLLSYPKQTVLDHYRLSFKKPLI